MPNKLKYKYSKLITTTSSVNIWIISINVTYLQDNDDMQAVGDFDLSDPWMCDELVYMLQQRCKQANQLMHKQAYD